MRIILLSDLHFSENEKNVSSNGNRNLGLGDISFLRLVHRINRWLKPDLVVICGDLTNAPDDCASLDVIAEITKKLIAPVIVIPGNHDFPPDEFYKRMPRPPDFMDVKGVRFIPFAYDEQRPGANAHRSAEDILRMRRLCENFAGRVVSVQHVPLCRKGETPSPFYYDNAEEMFSDQIFLALSGHFHKGFIDLNQSSMKQICAPALCESPYAYLVIDMDDDTGTVSVSREELRLPDGYCDYHIHTKLAYCQENLDTDRLISCTKDFNLSSFALTEHSGHLLVPVEKYGYNGIFSNGLVHSEIRRRDRDYREILDYVAFNCNFIRGMEVDVALDGTLIADPQLLDGIDLKIGAVHCLGAKPSYEEAGKRLMILSESLLANGCRVLAHPFRAFRRNGLPVPRELFEPMAFLLKKYGAIAEINYHTNDPEPDFFKMCLEQGIRFSLGSDAHNLYEVGELYPHLAFLKQIGASKDNLFSVC